MSKKVTIRCYYKEEKMDRDKALEFYKKACAMCEGSERERYLEIVMDLMADKDYCDDKVY